MHENKNEEKTQNISKRDESDYRHSKREKNNNYFLKKRIILSKVVIFGMAILVIKKFIRN